MAEHTGSIRRKLQAGFALSAAGLAALMALFMDQALHHSLELEDAQVMEGQARALLRQWEGGRRPVPGEPSPRPEKAAWRFLDAQSVTLAESPDMPPPDALPALRAAEGPPREFQVQGRTYAVVARAWEAGSQRGTLMVVMDRTHEGALVRGFRQVLLLGVLGAGGVGLLLAGLVASWGLAPLRGLIREAEALGDRSLDRRLAAGQFPAELQELVASLNSALDRLQEAFERLSHLGGELAHELRTPLQNLRGSLETRALRSSPIAPSELGALVEECDRMEALVEQILLLADLEQGQAALQTERLTVRDLLEECAGFFEAASEAGETTLQVQCPPDLMLSGNRLLWSRAVHNLVSNALRHTPPGGRVQLGARPLGDGLELMVADTGAGVAPEWIPRLGTPFFRPPGDRTPGHGLGLAIVRRLVEGAGGTLAIDSAPGRGTRVVLWVPRG